MRIAKVFLDTNVLLKSFLSYRRYKEGVLERSKLPIYLIDSETEKFTFEKCIYEAYLAFRGIGGKKPDEGRGDWANRFLKKLDDPNSIAKMISKFHGNNKGYTFYWLSQIEGVSIQGMKEDIKYIRDEDKERFKEETRKFEELKLQRELYWKLCDEFCSMIKEFSIRELSYIEIFGTTKQSGNFEGRECPTTLDSFVRSTAIPSEDFEIVFSAERICADIFITDDKKLITCSKSLGLYSGLKPSAFCTSIEYEEKKKQWRTGTMSAKLE